VRKAKGSSAKKLVKKLREIAMKKERG